MNAGVVLALFEWRPLTELVLQTSKHEWPRETQAVVVVNLSLLLLLSRPLSLSRSLAALTDWNSLPLCFLTQSECCHILVLSENISLSPVSPGVASDCP